MIKEIPKDKQQFCNKYGGMVVEEFDLSLNEACPGICDAPNQLRIAWSGVRDEVKCGAGRSLAKLDSNFSVCTPIGKL